MTMAIRPSLTRFSIRLGCLSLLLLPALPAQELMELRLKDGRVLVGDVQGVGENYRVQTSAGQVTVAQRDVAQTRNKADLQRDLRGLASSSGDSPFARINVARQARDYGLDREMWRHLDGAVEQLEQAEAQSAGTDATWRLLRDFLAELEPELLDKDLRQAPTSKRVEAMLREFRANTSPARELALVELLVREPNADQLLRQHARRDAGFRQRIAALRALERRSLAGNERFVLRTAVLDRNEKVRTAAIEIGRDSATADDVHYMAGGLAHPNAKVRVRTAEALAEIGHRAALEPLVKAGPFAAAGLASADDGGATRGHVAFLRQTSYIRDFDVEVAQASFIADPKVDVIQSGSVLDVTVAGISTVRIVRAYRGALQRLAGSDPGADPRIWANWLANLPAPATPAKTAGR